MGPEKNRNFLRSKNFGNFSFFIENCMKIENCEIGNFRKFLRFSKIFEIDFFSFFIENCMKIENFEIKIFRKKHPVPLFGHEVWTFCNVSLRVFYEIPSDQKQMKIMFVYFQKNSGFPMLRSTQNDQKYILLFGHA